MNVSMYGEMYNYAVGYYNIKGPPLVLKECRNANHPVKKVLLCNTVKLKLTVATIAAGLM